MEFAIYHLPRPAIPLAEAFARVRAQFSVHFPDKAPGQLASAVSISSPPIKEFPPPPADSLRDTGKGINDADSEELAESESVSILEFVYPSGDGQRDRHQAAMRFAQQFASLTGGLLWDEQTGQLFSQEAWDTQRVRPWRNTHPIASNYFVVNTEPSGPLMRVQSWGLGKFALPDLRVDRVARGNIDMMNALINLTAQMLVQGAEVGEEGTLSVNVMDAAGFTRHALVGDASGKATITLRRARRDDDDVSENRLLEIVFPGGPDSELQVRHDILLAGLFGSKDPVQSIEVDEALRQASARARHELRQKQKLFQNAWPSYDRLMIKGPFPRDDGGEEWMWVEVVEWRGETLYGILSNSPRYVSALRSGSRVQVELEDVFDYIHRKADGQTEGHLTAELLDKQLRKRE